MIDGMIHSKPTAKTYGQAAQSHDARTPTATGGLHKNTFDLKASVLLGSKESIHSSALSLISNRESLKTLQKVASYFVAPNTRRYIRDRALLDLRNQDVGKFLLYIKVQVTLEVFNLTAERGNILHTSGIFNCCIASNRFQLIRVIIIFRESFFLFLRFCCWIS